MLSLRRHYKVIRLHLCEDRILVTLQATDGLGDQPIGTAAEAETEIATTLREGKGIHLDDEFELTISQNKKV